MTSVRALLVATALLALPLAAVAAPPAVTHDEFKTFLETRDALLDERVQKLPEGKRVAAIATKNFKMKPAALEAIVAKVEAEGGEKGVGEKTKAAIEESVAGSALKGRLLEVRVDSEAPHVVTYVVWKNEDPKKLDEEVALLAARVGAGGPITSTFHLTAKNAAGQAIFLAKIGGDRTANIKEDRIAEWATTRYARLFEVEKRPE